MKRIILSCIAAFGVACAGSSQAYAPASVETKQDADTLFHVAGRVLEERGYRTAMNPQNLSIETREKEVAISSVPKLSYKYYWYVETGGGVLKVQAYCKENSAMSRTEFEDCGDERPDALVEEQQQLVDDILAMTKQEADSASGPEKPKVEAKADESGPGEADASGSAE